MVPTWTDWESLGGLLSVLPAAVSWGPNRLDVFVIGRDNALWHRSNDGTNWAAWESLGGLHTSPPAAVTSGANRIDVFVKAADNSIRHRTYDGSNWAPWESLGGTMISAAAAVTWGSGSNLCVCSQHRQRTLASSLRTVVIEANDSLRQASLAKNGRHDTSCRTIYTRA